LKKAVLVAMANEMPFSELANEIHPKLEAWYSRFEFDSFYVYGRELSRLERYLRRKLEQVRWGKFHLLLRIYDKVSLSIYKIRKPKVKVEGKTIQVDVPEDLRHLSIKILFSSKILIDLGYEIIVRTTASSVLNPRLTSEYISNLVSTEVSFYSGREVIQQDGFRFVSGSFCVWNNNALNTLYLNRRKLDFSLIDDVCFGKFFKKIQMSPIPLPSTNITSLSDLNNLRNLGSIAHFRCKTGTRKRNDLEVMLALEERFGDFQNA
jgi:hypothetical protein